MPFSAVGAIWLLYLLGYNMSIGVWVGLIALMGVDAETGVFMLLYLDLAYEERRAGGAACAAWRILQEAIVHGAVKRIRPKFMTVATMFVGLVPIMWSTGAGRGRDEAHRRAHDRRNFHFFHSGAGGLSGNLRGMEMAFGKTASCLILAAALASAAQFPVRHEHLERAAPGVMTVDENGVSFAGAKEARLALEVRGHPATKAGARKYLYTDL